MDLPTIVAYGGMVFSILAVWTHDERWQKIYFLFAAILLLAGAIGLKNNILIITQSVVFLSAVLNGFDVPQKITAPVVIGVGLLTFIFLLNAEDAPKAASFFAGTAGLLLIAVGISLIPWRTAYAALAVGSGAMVFYSWSVSAWPWFWLNIFFAGISIWRLMEKPKINPSP